MATARPTKRAKSEQELVFESPEEEELALKMAERARKAEARSLQSHQEGSGKKVVSGQEYDDVKPTFLTKAERQAAALARLEERRQGGEASHASSRTMPSFSSSSSESRGGKPTHKDLERERERDRERERERDREREASRDGGGGGTFGADRTRDKESLQLIREQYLGKRVKKKTVVKPSEKFSKIFQFEWEATDDTSQDINPIYNSRMSINPLFGRGYIAGVDLQEQRKTNAFNKTLVDKRQAEERTAELQDGSLTHTELRERERARRRVAEDLKDAEMARNKRLEASSIGLKGKHWKEKALEEMNERDWRIFREDFDILVRGGRAPMPLRSWEECKDKIPEPILRAISDLKYVEPSPIQRQAIPIGLEWRDVIGIAETGSGKTCAFVVPMLAYIANLPAYRRERLAEEGPLAMIMAPTRELAQQIEVECQRLSVHLGFKTVSVVGGQSIQDQGFHLREGVEMIIGTPGRMKDAIESRYLVLNQCNYVVLDEADRMVDMGFEQELNFVLDSMAGLLKSEAEDEAYEQEEAARRGEALYRVTAMFSATMPAAVELMAKTYLRHPAIVSIGDRDSGKNMRIEQVVEMCNEASKSSRLCALAQPKTPEDKFIVFVNEKKRCDMVARSLEKAGIRCSILHGGKSQDQREASLEQFRNGAFQVLVATDVAGRGLDIPDVTSVINYDMPAKIENYCHRIGRTGRAGKNGLATTLLTESDSEVFYELNQYLVQCEAAVPHALARHPAAAAPAGSITEGGKLAGSRRDTVLYA